MIEYKQIDEAPDYWIGNNGKIISRRVKDKELEVKQHHNPKTGYMQAALCTDEKKSNGLYGRKTMYPHRLVAQYFVDNPNDYNTVNHINGIKTHNFVSNLEWCTQQHNRASVETGVNVASVYHCCKGRVKRPKHFFFKYKED